MSARPIVLVFIILQLVGCASWRQTAPLPVGSTFRAGQLVIYSDFELPSDHRLVAELQHLRVRISEVLALPEGGEPVEVYLFQRQRTYDTFLKAHYPNLPKRRALFVESDTHLRVYACWGDRVAEDLRHEVSHGYMHSILPELPLWIDEGLAEGFEVSADKQGLNQPHVEHLLAVARSGAWRPDLAGLASIREIDKMGQTEYAEAWAWMHWLFNSTPQNRELARQYFAALRERRGTEPLEVMIQRQNPDAAAELMKHLQSLGG